MEEAEALRVRGHPGFVHPGACLREVNNLKCAQRSGVALQAKEAGKKKKKKADFQGQRAPAGIIPN